MNSADLLVVSKLLPTIWVLTNSAMLSGISLREGKWKNFKFMDLGKCTQVISPAISKKKNRKVVNLNRSWLIRFLAPTRVTNWNQ